LKNVAYFSAVQKLHLRTTLLPQFTTLLPSKNHVLHTTFPKTPLKNKGKSSIFAQKARSDFFVEK